MLCLERFHIQIRVSKILDRIYFSLHFFSKIIKFSIENYLLDPNRAQNKFRSLSVTRDRVTKRFGPRFIRESPDWHAKYFRIRFRFRGDIRLKKWKMSTQLLMDNRVDFDCRHSHKENPRTACSLPVLRISINLNSDPEGACLSNFGSGFWLKLSKL